MGRNGILFFAAVLVGAGCTVQPEGSGFSSAGGDPDAGADTGGNEPGDEDGDDDEGEDGGSTSDPGSGPGSESGSPEEEGGGSTTTGDGCPPSSECTNDDECDGGLCIDCACTPIDGDPAYPDPGEGCPDGMIDGTDYGYPFCSPPCEDGTCPDADSGTAVPTCRIATDPGSQDPCENFEGPCDTEGEICQFFGTGLACAPPPSYCTLNCTGNDCPDAMTCLGGETGEGVCIYE